VSGGPCDTARHDGNAYRRCTRLHGAPGRRAHRAALHALEVAPERSCVDKGLSGATRERPGLTTALAICRPVDTLVVTKLDRLARSLPDARDISAELVARDALSLGGAVHDSADPVGRLLFNVLGMVAKFERDLLRARVRRLTTRSVTTSPFNTPTQWIGSGWRQAPRSGTTAWASGTPSDANP
jgi:hypothetical protein